MNEKNERLKGIQALAFKLQLFINIYSELIIKSGSEPTFNANY